MSSRNNLRLNDLGCEISALNMNHMKHILDYETRLMEINRRIMNEELKQKTRDDNVVKSKETRKKLKQLKQKSTRKENTPRVDEIEQTIAVNIQTTTNEISNYNKMDDDIQKKKAYIKAYNKNYYNQNKDKFKEYQRIYNLKKKEERNKEKV